MDQADACLGQTHPKTAADENIRPNNAACEKFGIFIQQTIFSHLSMTTRPLFFLTLCPWLPSYKLLRKMTFAEALSMRSVSPA